MKHKAPNDRILMNVISMMNEILSIANTMVRKPALPDFRLASDQSAELMRICALDQLYTSLKSHVQSRCEQQMNVIGHENEGVQYVPAFAAVMKKGF